MPHARARDARRWRNSWTMSMVCSLFLLQLVYPFLVKVKPSGRLLTVPQSDIIREQSTPQQQGTRNETANKRLRAALSRSWPACPGLCFWLFHYRVVWILLWCKSMLQNSEQDARMGRRKKCPRAKTKTLRSLSASVMLRAHLNSLQTLAFSSKTKHFPGLANW